MYNNVCPNCGYCPHCGRGGYARPYPRPIPYYPPALPYWGASNVSGAISKARQAVGATL